jgi:hypothetical protein
MKKLLENFKLFWKWFACDIMGWHLSPISQGFDGASYYGECRRCGRHVLEDSQGNWF